MAVTMDDELGADLKVETALPFSFYAGFDRCVSCNACRTDCPISNATDCLHPLRLVRMLALGLIEEVVRLPDIWYCLQCNHCSFGCPMTVRPSALIRYLRREALRRGAVNLEQIEKYEVLCARLHRARYKIISKCQSESDLSDYLPCWDEEPAPPTAPDETLIPATKLLTARGPFKERLDALAGYGIALDACMTCNECATACPVAYEHSVFNPVSTFRMVNYGLVDELLLSATIWLCLQCQSCTDACSQKVSGHLVFQALQELAIERGSAPGDLRERMRQFDRAIFPHFLKEVEQLFCRKI